MNTKKGNRNMTVKRRKDTVARVIDRLAAIKSNPKPKGPKGRRPQTRKNRSLNNESGFAKTSNFSVPAAYGSTTKVEKPNFGRARTIIKHSEYIGDIAGSIAFTVQMTIPCNPGVANSFPWLAQISNAYEKHCIKSLKYRFETEAPTSFTGSVFLSPEYNPQDPVPVNKMNTFQNENTVRTVPWRSVANTIPQKYLKVYNDYYIRAGTLAANIDLKTYDPLVLYVCTQGQAGSATVGEIWVDYEIELINPIGNIGAVGSGTYYATAALSSTTLAGGSSIGLMQVNQVVGNNLAFTIPNCVIGQEYMWTAYLRGTVLAEFNFGTLVGCNAVSSQVGAIDYNAASTEATTMQTVTATATTIGFTVNLGGTTMTAYKFAIAQMPSGMAF
jgi:hypothetical protein